MRIVLDCETDGLLDTVTKIHCVCYFDIDTKESHTLISYTEMIELLQSEDLTIVGHNVIRFDKVVFKRILGISLDHIRWIDSLGVSWYLYPERKKHGLEEWGEDLGVKKPMITDWSHHNITSIMYRCQQDVKINTLLFDQQIAYLLVLYTESNPTRIIEYLSFKMDCAAEQEEVKWKLDVEKCRANMDELQKEITAKKDGLRQVMPRVETFKLVERPKIFFKKDGTHSKLAENWLFLLKAQDLPAYHVGTVKVITGSKEGNPNSFTQLKKWLFDLGWVPQTFRYERDDYQSPIRAIPQINTKEGDLCKSIEILIEGEPSLAHLDGLSSANHKFATLQGFMENKDKDDYLQAQISGLTNTLRFQHTTVVNLPTTIKDPEGYVRGVLIAPNKDYILCGADVTGLENTTRDHFMYPYDPQYVEDMRVPFFDSHLDIALLAGLVTKEQSDWYKWVRAEPKDKPYLEQFVSPILKALFDTEFKALKAQMAEIRDRSKKSNFASVYGAGIAKIALTANISEDLARIFYNAYWARNWSVRKIADACVVKWVNEQMWLFNPISQFWYSLRFLKDRFSTLNQGSGSYCFDRWVRRVRSRGIKMCGQFHDEFVFPLLRQHQLERDHQLQDAMTEANAELNMNVQFTINVQFGETYKDIH